MTTRELKITGVLMLVVFCHSIVNGQRTIHKVDSDQYRIDISKEDGSPVTILQVTDLHLGSTDEGKWKRDLETCRRIKKLVETHDPDMIAITGDLFDGNKPHGTLLASYAVNFFDSLDRPWLFMFGNHDPEGGFGRAAIAEVFAESKWGVLGKHSVNNEWSEKYDYVVDILVNGERKPVWQIFGFDSGAEKGNKSIKEEQLKWYRDISNNTASTHKEQIRAISMFHIPLIEFQYLQDDESIKKQGFNEEKVYYEEDDGSVYKTFLDVGNVEAVFCGHDHYNNYWGTYKGGIILAYGYISGVATKYAWPPGGKLITLPINGGKIVMENVIPDMGK
ncbi:metallophosphoesterase [uncultured Kriegella sp.]|uniref:metallophosphoesterase n=1 Tax=uncultured Kriegella sp. TaxID=1798910 RepID=UPI0030DA625E|tara:strand:+ start:2379 stop:3380 length:1002 start_codon:yes stop_codon:yes gene_type:complete